MDEATVKELLEISKQNQQLLAFIARSILVQSQCDVPEDLAQLLERLIEGNLSG